MAATAPGPRGGWLRGAVKKRGTSPRRAALSGPVNELLWFFRGEQGLGHCLQGGRSAATGGCYKAAADKQEL